MNNKKRIVLVILAAVIVAGYGYGVSFFSKHVYANTSLNQQDKSFTERDKLLERSWEGYQIEIIGRGDKKLTLTPEMIDMEESIADPQALNQPAWAWPVGFIKSTELDQAYQITFNLDKFQELYAASPLAQDLVAPVDAYILYNAETGLYEIVPEVMGDTLDVDKLHKALQVAMANQAPAIILNAEYQNPAIYADDLGLNAKLDKMNAIAKQSYKYSFGDSVENLTGDRLLALFDEGESDYTLNRDRTAEYIAQLAKQYDTLGDTHLFNATGIGQIEVKGGNYGWDMDEPPTVDALVAAIESGQSQDLTPVYKKSAFAPGLADIGNTYVEIDQSRQRMWYYKDGELLVETAIVTGKVSQGYRTPTGVWSIYSKQTNRYLQGFNRDGSKYKSHVNYWLPFTGGYGIHDSSWRGSYGGGIYYYNGSHGCVNTPYSKVKVIYNNIEVGCPVVVYWS